MKPERKTNIPVTVKSTRKVSKVWVATPDSHAGAVQELPFMQDGYDVSFTLPSLEYWTMAVMEGENVEDGVYITGEAVQQAGYAAYDLAHAVAMNRSEGGKVFKATVYLKANELFKFVNAPDWRVCKSYCAEYKDYEFNSMVTLAHLSTSMSKEDYKFKVDESGYYDITIDLEQMRVYVVKSSSSSISSPVMEGQEDGKWYALNGVAVAAPRKGVYVKKGKKISFK